MKKLLFTVILFTFYSQVSFSQFSKNDVKLTLATLPLIGNYTEGNESGIDGIVIKPSVGYFLSNSTSLELNFSYTRKNNITLNKVDAFIQSYALVPTLRHHFINNQKFRFFIDLGAGLGGIRYDPKNKNERGLTNSFDTLSGGIYILNAGIGGNYFFNKHWGLEFIIPYIQTHNFTSEEAIKLYQGIGPTIGVNYIL